jgi:hypothetical protein
MMYNTSCSVYDILVTIVTLSLTRIMYYDMKTYGVVEEQLHFFLTSALDGRVVNFTPPPLSLPLKKPPVLIGRRLGGAEGQSGHRG